jgi:tetratricopeptide (TPR) repeat protein
MEGALFTERSLFTHLLPPGGECVDLHGYLCAVYRLLDNRASLIEAQGAFGAAVQHGTAGLDFDGLSSALRHLVGLKQGDGSAAVVKDGSTVVAEVASAGVVFKPDQVVAQMLQPSVVAILGRHGAALRKLFSAYTSDQLGVVMPWAEVVHARAALSSDRFLSLAASSALFPTLSEEELLVLFDATRLNNELASERAGVGAKLLFPHFHELLCRCAHARTVSSGSTRTAALTSRRGSSGLAKLDGEGLPLDKKLGLLFKRMRLAADEPGAEAPAAVAVDEQSGTTQLPPLRSVSLLRPPRSTPNAVSAAHKSWMMDSSESAAERVAMMLSQLELPPPKARLRGPASSSGAGRLQGKQLLSNMPDENGFRKMPQQRAITTDLSGPKPALLKELLFAPPAPHAVARLLEAGLTYHNTADYKRSVSTFLQAEALWAVVTADEPPLIGRLHIWNSIGGAFESAGEDEQALAYYMDAKTLAEKLPANHVDRALSFSNIGSVCFHWAHYELALRCFECAMAIREQALGTDHVDTASTWNNVGCCLDGLGLAEQARYRYQLALQCMKPQLRIQHPRVAVVLRNLQRSNRLPSELHLGAQPLSCLFRLDKDRTIPGPFFMPAPYVQKGGKKKKGKGKKKKK